MALDPIVINVQSGGVQQFIASLRTVEQTVIAHERNILRAAEQGTRARQQTVKRETDDKEKSFARLAREADRWAKEEARVVEKAEREKTSAAERETRRREQIIHNSARMAARLAKQQADAELAEAKRVADAKERYAKAFGGQMSAGVRSGFGLVGAVGRQVVQGALTVGGGFGLADSVSREVQLRGASADIAASTVGQSVSTDMILRSAKGVANTYGMDASKVVAAIGKFKDLTGDTQRGMTMLPEIAKLSTAFGADVSELAANAGNIAMSNPGMSNDDIHKLLRVQTMQGAVGAVELKDMAKYGGRLTAGASLFGGDRSTNIATMGAIAQVARQHGGAASPAEAAMAAQRFATDVQKHASSLQAKGITVSDGKGGMRDAREIMRDMLNKSGGDVTKLTQFGLGERGIRALTGFSDIYRQAGGGKAGQAAVLGEFDKFTKGVSDDEVDERASQRLAETDKQLEMAMNSLKDAAAKELLPALVKLIPVLQDATPMFGELIRAGTKFGEFFLHNPIAGFGAVLTASVAKEVAAAQLAKVLENSISSKLGGAGLLIGTAYITAKLAQLAVDTDVNKTNKVFGDAKSHEAEAAGLALRIKRGDATPEDKARAQALVGEMTRDREKVLNEGVDSGVKSLTKTLGRATGQGAAIDEMEKTEQATQKKALGDIDRSTEALVAALKSLEASNKALAEANKKGGPGGAAPGSPNSTDAPSRTQPLSARP